MMLYLDLIRLAVPIGLSSAAYVAAEQIDTLLMAPLGSVSLGSVSLVSNMAGVIYVTSRGLGIGQSHLVAKYRGKDELDKAIAIFNHSLFIRFIYGLTTSALLLILSNNIGLLNLSPSVAEGCQVLIPYFALGSFLCVIQSAFRDLFESFEDAKTPLVIILMGIFLRAGFLYALVSHPTNDPWQGVKSCGQAFIIGQCLTLILLIVRSQMRFKWFKPSWNSPFNLNFGNKNVSHKKDSLETDGSQLKAKLDPKILRELLVVSGPYCLQLFGEVAAFLATGLMIGQLSADDLAARQIANSISTLTFMVALGISQASLIIISRERGRGNSSLALSYTKHSLVLTWATMACLGLWIYFFRTPIGVFYQVGRPAFEILMPMLVITAIFQIADGTQCVAGSLLRAWDDSKIPALLSMLAWWGVAIPLGGFLGFELNQGSVGVWTGLACGVFAAGVMSLLRLSFVVNRMQKLFPSTKINQTPQD